MAVGAIFYPADLLQLELLQLLNPPQDDLLNPPEGDLLNPFRDDSYGFLSQIPQKEEPIEEAGLSFAKETNPFNPAEGWDRELNEGPTSPFIKRPGFKLEDLRLSDGPKREAKGSPSFLGNSIFMPKENFSTATKITAGTVVGIGLARTLLASRGTALAIARIHPVLLGAVVLGGIAALALSTEEPRRTSMA